MKKVKTIISIIVVFILLVPFRNMSGKGDNSGESKSAQTSTTSTQTTTKTTQATTKSKQTSVKSGQTGTKSKQTTVKSKKPILKSEPKKVVKDPGIVRIGEQSWAVANLNVSTFRNGDSIPEAKTNKEWVAAGEAGKPAWCYYNNDPVAGQKYGKLYNWFAVNDPRGLAPVGWTLASDEDWARLSYSLGGQEAGTKMKSISGWSDGNNGTNDSGFLGLPGGYRIENGLFKNLGSIGIWWSSSESSVSSAYDHYLQLSGTLGRSSSPKQRGSSVRCIRK
jgi:uncharacterized protein (TIGR02145 family)